MAKKAEQNGKAVVEPQSVIELCIPIVNELPAGYVPQHVDAQLNAEEGEELKRIHQALDSMNNVRIRDRGLSYADAFRWVLSEVRRARLANQNSEKSR